MKTIIETKRLLIRHMDNRDVDGIFALDSNPNVLQYIGTKPFEHREQAQQIVDMNVARYKTTGLGRLAVVEKETDQFIGWTGMKHEDMLRPSKPYIDLGYRFIEEYWGKGYATESALASMHLAFDILNIETIGICADEDNAGSLNIINKLGFHYIDDFVFEGTLCKYFELTRVDWLASPQADRAKELIITVKQTPSK